MILNWSQFIFEGKKDQEWFERNKDLLVTKKVELEDLPKYDVPEGIIERMRDWPIIMKSPLGNSFYSTDKTTYDYKPDKSLRVSDHWNFISKKDGNIHCRTNIPVENNSVWAIGEFDQSKKIYNIIHTEVSEKWEKEQREIIEKRLKKLKYLKDPSVIEAKREFKRKVEESKITCELEYDGNLYKGTVVKYTGSEIKIIDDRGRTVFQTKELKGDLKKLGILVLYDLGQPISDPFRFDP